MNGPHSFHQWTLSILWENIGLYMLVNIICCKINYFADVTISDLNLNNSCLCLKFSFPYDLALLHITTCGARQPAVLKQQTAVVVMVPLFTIQINQICEVPFISLFLNV